MVTNSGYTMMRPLVMDFRDDIASRTIGDQFMFGPSILVNPVTHPGVHEREVYLPKGNKWFDFWTGKSFSGGEKTDAPAPINFIPLYVRAGSIVPYGPSVQWATQKVDAPIELRVYPGADGSFTLYDDAGDGYAYEHGEYSTIPLQWSNKVATLTIGTRQGSFPGMQNERTFRVVLVKPSHGSGNGLTADADQTVRYTGKEISIHLSARR
jgi:alpha-D-xyloside xylohydrolase